MNGLGRVRTWLDRIIVAVFMLSITHPAWGIPIPLPSGSIIPGTVWQISYAAPISLEFDAAVTTNNTVGTIIETTIRTNLAPLAIDFLQVFETTTSGISGGLRLNFQEKVTNASPLAWPYYRMTLVDAISGPDTVLNNGDHPAPPHFHQTKQIATTPATFVFEGALMFTGEDLTKYQATFLGMPQTDPSNDLLLGDGAAVVALTKDFEVISLLIHERQFGLCPQVDSKGNPLPCLNDPARRQFQLVEQPMPLPGTLALTLGCIVALIGTRLRLRRPGEAISRA